MDGDPHAVIEGMLIGSFAIGAHEGYIYVRAEYPLAVKRLKLALAAAQEYGFLGDDALGSGWSFPPAHQGGRGRLRLRRGDGPPLASIEGRRGMPRSRPPFPAVSGLWGKPTNINNVETWANIPVDHRQRSGRVRSARLARIAVAPRHSRSPVASVNGVWRRCPMGSTLRHVIFDVGGGVQDGKRFKAVQLGGPSGGCLPAELLDTPVDYESLAATGAIVGSGGMVVADENTCMVDLARYFLQFTQNESCGKCVPCRLGTKRMLEILERITRGEGVDGDIERLEKLALTVKRNSLCGLGQTAPNPVLTTIRYFRDEYEAHIKQKRCPALACKALIRLHDHSRGLSAGAPICCARCPVNAAIGDRRQSHSIDPRSASSATHAGSPAATRPCRWPADSQSRVRTTGAAGAGAARGLPCRDPTSGASPRFSPLQTRRASGSSDSDSHDRHLDKNRKWATYSP